jgi:hypothetical protein
VRKLLPFPRDLSALGLLGRRLLGLLLLRLRLCFGLHFRLRLLRSLGGLAGQLLQLSLHCIGMPMPPVR